jgi:hypothetical protein
MMLFLQWVAFLLLSFLGGWVILANWIIPTRPKGGSLIPAIGGVFVAISFTVAPIDGLKGFWWLPLIADLGSAPLFVMTAGFLVYQAVSRKK